MRVAAWVQCRTCIEPHVASAGVDEEGPVLHGEQVIASKGKDARIVHCSSRMVPVLITQEQGGGQCTGVSAACWWIVASVPYTATGKVVMGAVMDVEMFVQLMLNTSDMLRMYKLRSEVGSSHLHACVHACVHTCVHERQ